MKTKTKIKHLTKKHWRLWTTLNWQWTADIQEATFLHSGWSRNSIQWAFPWLMPGRATRCKTTTSIQQLVFPGKSVQLIPLQSSST